jgi:choice-of-anchor B domain-containing protein
MNKILLVVIFLFAGIIRAQTPCVSGMAGIYPCSGYDLQSFIPCTVFGAQNANDSWGWTDPVGGVEYALLGLDNGVAFLDISDPTNPLYLGKLPTHTDASLWRDVKVYNNHAYVVSEASGHGMQVFDLTRLRSVSNPPEIFTEDAHYSGFGSAHNIVINEQQGYAYGVGTSSFSGGPHFVNIQDPLNPIAEGGYAMDAYSHDGQVVTYDGPDPDYTGREIYIGSNETEVVIVDITNKSNPQGISTISYSNTAYTHQGWLTEDHSYFILGDEIDEINFGFNTRTVVFDLTDLDNPQLSFEYSGPTPATDHNGYTKGDSFYLANYTAGLRVIDISDISNGNMVETGYFDVFTANDNAGYNGAWNVYPYFESGTVLISSLVFSDPNYIPGIYLVKESTLGVNDNTFSDNFSIYPNPSETEINVSSKNKNIDSVVISDAMGKILKEYLNVNSENLKVDISGYSTGIYFVRINDSESKKIIKN